MRATLAVMHHVVLDTDAPTQTDTAAAARSPPSDKVTCAFSKRWLIRPRCSDCDQTLQKKPGASSSFSVRQRSNYYCTQQTCKLLTKRADLLTDNKAGNY